MPKFISINEEIVECPKCGSTDFREISSNDKQMFIYCLACDEAGVDMERNKVVLDLADDK